MHPSASFSATIRARIENEPGAFARLAAAIGEMGGLLGAIDLVRVEPTTKVRDITVLAADERHLSEIVDAVRALPGIEIVNVSDRVFLAHLGGKIEITRGSRSRRATISRWPTRPASHASHARSPTIRHASGISRSST